MRIGSHFMELLQGLDSVHEAIDFSLADLLDDLVAAGMGAQDRPDLVDFVLEDEVVPLVDF